MIVTYNVMQENPILGNGLGSHVISHARFIGTVPGVEVFEERGMEDYNSTEAASLVLRSLSELGILGFLGILWFLFHFHVGGTSSRAAISNGILVCFFLKLIRDGVYFPPEQFFFIFVYFLNHRQFKLETCAASTRDPIYLAVNSDQTA
jgi:O-antigen ligase